MIPLRPAAATCALALLLSGCGSSPKHAVPTQRSGPMPFTVAILPFDLVTKQKDPDAKGGERAGRQREGAHEWTAEEKTALRPEVQFLREVFANRFFTLSYKDKPLDRVDDLLAKAGARTPAEAQAMDPKALGQRLGVDAVVIGKIWQFSNDTFGIGYSRSIGGRIDMIDTRTGEMVWSAEHTESARGGLLFESGQVISAIENQKKNASSQAFLLLSEEFSRRTLESCPNATDVPKSELIPPAITLVRPPEKHDAFKVGETILVTAEGDPGMSGAFSLGRWRPGLPMTETMSGKYVGGYLVQPGDAAKDAAVTVTLTSGYGVSRSMSSGGVSVDAGQPAAPTNVSASLGAGGKVTFRWTTAAGTKPARVLIYGSDAKGPQKIAESTGNEATASMSGAAAGQSFTLVPVGANGVFGPGTSVVVK